MIAAIALGSGLFTFILLVNKATLASLENSLEDLAADNDLVVRSTGGDSFPENGLDKVLSVPGVRSAVPLVQNKAFLSRSDSSQKTMNLLGLDLLNDRSLRRGNAPDKRLLADPLAFMASPLSIALTQDFAKQEGLEIGSKVRLFTAKGPRFYVVRALLDGEGLGRAFGGAVVVMDLEASRLAYGKEAKTDQINVVAEDKGEISALARRLQDALGEFYSVEAPSAQVQGLRDLVQPFQQVLLFLGFLTTLMALFLISSTASMAIAERRGEIGVLRAIGISRGQVLGQSVAEFLLIGLAGSGLGALVAWLIVSAFLPAIQAGVVSQTQALVALKQDLLPLSVPILVTILGTFLTVAAVLVPVWQLACISPAEAMRPVESTPTKASMRWWWLNVSTGALLLLPLFFAVSAKFPFLHAAPVLGILLLAPRGCVWLLRATYLLASKLASPLVDLAWRYSVEKPARVEKTVRGLVVGLSLVFVISSVQSGFVHSLSQMFLKSSRPDFYVSSNGDFLSPMTLQPLDDSLQKELAKVKGVQGVFGQRIVTVDVAGRKVKLSAFDEVPPETLDVPYSYFEVIDRPIPEAGRELYHSPDTSIFVSESFATLFGKKTGDTVELRSEGRAERARIVGLVRDFTAGGGRIYISRDRYRKLWNDSLVTGIAIVLQKSASLPEVRDRVEKQFGPSHGILITVDRTIQEDVAKILKKSFASLGGIEAASLLVAVLGFLSSFLLEIRGRAQEISLLRVVGLTKRELSVFLLTEAILLGLAAAVVTVFLAAPVSWRLITNTLPALLGWVIDYSPEFGLCFYVVALSLAIASLSSWQAIRWARNLNIADGVKDE